MNNLDSQQRQETLKRRWQERTTLTTMENHQQQNYPPPPSNFYTRLLGANPPSSSNPNSSNNNNSLQSFPGLDDDLVSTVVPSVTVVLEGRSICQRINLHKHSSYQSLAKALRQMFVDSGDAQGGATNSDRELDLSNAVPGHIIAYEDMENDLLLAGDLNWKDFVRVARRIRILPIKANSKKGRGSV